MDMCGGAAVVGAMMAIAQLKPKINVTGIVPTTENMPSGNGVPSWRYPARLERQDRRDPQHRRRGAADSGRRALLWR